MMASATVHCLGLAEARGLLGLCPMNRHPGHFSENAAKSKQPLPAATVLGGERVTAALAVTPLSRTPPRSMHIGAEG